MKRLYFLLACLWLSVACFCLNHSPECESRAEVVACDFKIPDNPISRYFRSSYYGVSLEYCVRKLVDFKWSFAVFCPLSLACGLGVDLGRSYAQYLDWSAQRSPLKQQCVLLNSQKEMSCEQIQQALLDAVILDGRQTFLNIKKCPYSGVLHLKWKSRFHREHKYLQGKTRWRDFLN